MSGEGEDVPPFCEVCGCKLDSGISSYAAGEETMHYEEYPPDLPLTSVEAYELACIIESDCYNVDEDGRADKYRENFHHNVKQWTRITEDAKSIMKADDSG